tara:strand:- start:24 stop:920 length:897 start_codon:yes stop_codon:yes gene_type:complete
MSYIGRVEQKASDIRRFNVTGSTSATHTLTWSPPNEQSLIVTINGIKQQEDAYSVSGTTLTLTSALVSTDKMEVVGIQDVGETMVPGTGTITNDHISSSAAIALSKLATDPSNASNLATGTVPTARLGSGTASSSTILYGNNTWVTAPSGLFSSYAIIADQKSSGTEGGTATSGAWRTRDLNTEIADPDGIVSISTNEFTLDAGTYLIKWSAPFAEVVFAQTRLYNSTDTTEVEVGQSALVNASMTGISVGSARTTIAGSKAFRIEYQVNTTKSSEGCGRASSFGTEQYALVEIYKEA